MIWGQGQGVVHDEDVHDEGVLEEGYLWLP